MKYYIIDAFTDKIFKGNPAGICILDKEISESYMQKIARENNLPETAFVYKKGKRYTLRWFTPKFEIDLCGHATLATAHMICTVIEPEVREIEFDTISGVLKVTKKEDLYEMIFPKRMPEQVSVTTKITEALGIEPLEVYSERDLYVVVKNEEAVRSFVPDYDRLQRLNKWLGIVITAKGNKVDFVSRYFCPELHAEDSVTGSSHSSLIPLWKEKLNKDKFIAEQLSERGGLLYCELEENDVKISGKACTYLKGEIFVD